MKCVTASGASWKLFFGEGTKVIVASKQEVEPQYYRLVSNDNQTEVCLATGFTRHNATKGTMLKGTEASQITKDGKPTGVYNQVAFLDGEQKCGDYGPEKSPEPCISTLEPDEMVNLASLTIFGLRLIFMKTVVFNVLMTLRLWISQCEYQTSGLANTQTRPSKIQIIQR
ncbi:hypothetical protein CRENBAI_004972 [Crenichthys baileyi]|uniref:Uncharacterized protein n=1 Tax=Crenichthys baileyi TaxID=28760 RepID=A0AAV9RGH9_9TELE